MQENGNLALPSSPKGLESSKSFFLHHTRERRWSFADVPLGQLDLFGFQFWIHPQMSRNGLLRFIKLQKFEDGSWRTCGHEHKDVSGVVNCRFGLDVHKAPRPRGFKGA